MAIYPLIIIKNDPSEYLKWLLLKNFMVPSNLWGRGAFGAFLIFFAILFDNSQAKLTIFANHGFQFLLQIYIYFWKEFNNK